MHCVPYFRLPNYECICLMYFIVFYCTALYCIDTVSEGLNIVSKELAAKKQNSNCETYSMGQFIILNLKKKIKKSSKTILPSRTYCNLLKCADNNMDTKIQKIDK